MDQEDAPRHGVKTNISVNGNIVDDDTLAKATFRFGRLVPCLSDKPLILNSSHVDAVGKCMTTGGNFDGRLTAGYTYFAQFVDHDITKDKTDKTDEAPDGAVTDPNLLVQEASPTLDLDSVYGRPIKDGCNTPISSDGFSFEIAPTFPVAERVDPVVDSKTNNAFANDLPRRVVTVKDADGNDTMVGAACIPDTRNDENLIVAQTHLAWLLFHNATAKTLKGINPNITSETLFSMAREVVIRHYQHIVLHDFVKGFVDEAVFQDVIIDGNAPLLNPVPGEIPAMPLEFSVAAFRMGHSMVRQGYPWNLVFTGNRVGLFSAITPAAPGGPRPPNAERSFFFFTSGPNKLLNGLALPSNWIADWTRFFKFTGTGIADQGVKVNQDELSHMRRLDPLLAVGLGKIPAGFGEPDFNLATANLKRGSLRGLPSGQDFAEAIGETPLSESQMVERLPDDFISCIRDAGYHKKTPLWLYILQEANLTGNPVEGEVDDENRLGRVGSRIICETFRALVIGSTPSIINEGWTPDQSPIKLRGRKIDTLPEMLAFTDDSFRIVNPLETDPLPVV